MFLNQMQDTNHDQFFTIIHSTVLLKSSILNKSMLEYKQMLTKASSPGVW